MRPSIVSLEVNGSHRDFLAQPGTTLLTALREALGLTATRKGCETGSCGACTVILDGEPVMSCLVPVCQVEGAEVQTVEGLAQPVVHAVQAAFLQHGAAQCGICTPGFLMAAAALLDENPRPSREEARVALAGNLCRCTGYQKIVDAVVHAIAEEA